jgi:hypothetical protein
LTGIASIPNGKFFRFAQDMGLFSASKIRTAEPKNWCTAVKVRLPIISATILKYGVQTVKD